tara:strand:+ start:485 stop:589 length:105 start_codon:yes stop_codon:yes gene_type:complete
VLRARNLSLGEKNGKEIGMKLDFAVIDVKEKGNE